MVFRLQLTSLYIPLTDFTINDKDGFRILYENLIQSGPAYRLIVHDSPTWHQIRDQTENPERLTILSEKEANYYKELSKDFFAPITQAAPYYEDKQGKKSMANLTADLCRALSYILIAHDYKARIFEDDILEYYNPLESLEKNGFSEDCVNRVKFVDSLLKGYKRNNISTILINKNVADFQTVQKILAQTEIAELSGLSYLFGVLEVKKDQLKQNIKEKMTTIFQNEWFPYALSGGVLCLSYYYSLDYIRPALVFLAGLGGHALGKFDFKEYIPPIQDSRIITLCAKQGTSLFSYSTF